VALDFPVRNDPGTLNGSEKFRNARFLHAAADWKVRAPFFTTMEVLQTRIICGMVGESHRT